MDARLSRYLFLTLGILLLVFNSLYVIRETERAVVLRFGRLIETNTAPGLHVKVPGIDEVRVFDARVLTLDSQPENFYTLEKKRLIVDSYAKWRIEDVETYYRDKLRIASAQAPADRCVWNGDNERLRARAPLGPGASHPYGVEGSWRWDGARFTRGDRALSGEGMLLRGRHNRENACAALAALALLDVDAELALPAMLTFGGLPHRLEDLGVRGGVRWVNDSISTAPEAAVAALDAFGDEVETLIVGGFDRGYDFTPLAEAVLARGLRGVAALAPSGPRLLALLEGSGIETVVAADLDEAVAWCAERTSPGRACVFSPASPSYGRYRDFIERGEHLRRLVAARG
jgi:UDP-N-acetylmuramoylalanine--D-glutamate ligase